MTGGARGSRVRAGLKPGGGERGGEREWSGERELGSERVGEALRAEPVLQTGNLPVELESELDSGHVTRIPSHVTQCSHVI
eukprot:2662270-Rhodomonas_salina.1